MTWGTYYFFYECPQCGKKYRYELEGSADEVMRPMATPAT